MNLIVMKPKIALLSLLLILGFTIESSAITLTGSNGRKVEFAGIKDATPKGITAQVTAESDLIGLTWDKFDLAAMKEENPQVYAAYLAAKDGETVGLNLGIYMPEEPEEKSAPPPGGNRQYVGWKHIKVGAENYLLRMPLGSQLNGILLVSVGDYGRAFQYIENWAIGEGPLADLLSKHKLAIMSYEFEMENRDPTYVPQFVYAEKGSGERLLTAIDAIAKEIDRPDLSEAPIAIYGTERIGAAFAYNLIQWKPERMAAAFISKGAFYTGTPTEASAKVPILFCWGQYSNQHEIWNSEDTGESVLTAAKSLRPNWTAGIEFRGPDHQTLESEYFGREYLSEVLEMRLVERKANTPKVEESEGEGDSQKSDAEDQPVETSADEEEEGVDEPLLRELDRSAGLVGNFETEEILKLKEPDSLLGEDETFIPNNEIAQMWKKFITGQLEAPQPKPLN